MFTGIVDKIAVVENLLPSGGGYELTLKVSDQYSDLVVGESISVDGVCLTLKMFDDRRLFFDVSPETIRKSIIGGYKRGDLVNLERALTLNSRLGGHLVLGHVDAVGKIDTLIKRGHFYELVICYPSDIDRYIAVKGSISINGISLTVADKLPNNRILIAIIPHTYNNTSLKAKRPGDSVNIEVDVIARYVEVLIRSYEGNTRKGIENKLKEFLGGG